MILRRVLQNIIIPAETSKMKFLLSADWNRVSGKNMIQLEQL